VYNKLKHSLRNCSIKSSNKIVKDGNTLGKRKTKIYYINYIDVKQMKMQLNSIYGIFAKKEN